jgi:hypothetical protein
LYTGFTYVIQHERAHAAKTKAAIQNFVAAYAGYEDQSYISEAACEGMMGALQAALAQSIKDFEAEWNTRPGGFGRGVHLPGWDSEGLINDYEVIGTPID